MRNGCGRYVSLLLAQGFSSTNAVKHMPKPDEFWLRPDSDGITQPPLRTAWVRQTEKLLGVKLPQEYVRLLKRCNGGVARRDSYWFRDYQPCLGTRTRFRWIMGIPEVADPGVYRSHTVADSHDFTGAWDLPKELIVFTLHEADCHAICLDYRTCGKEGPPSLTFVDVDPYGDRVGGERIGQYDAHVFPLADDFETFVEGLFFSSSDHAYGLIGVGANIDKVAGEIRTTIGLKGVRMKNRSTYISAMSVHVHSQQDMYSAEHDQWKSWLSSRPDDDYHASILVQMNLGDDGYYDFPEHPECDWVIHSNIVLKHRQELETLVGSLGYEVVPLHVPDLKRLGY